MRSACIAGLHTCATKLLHAEVSAAQNCNHLTTGFGSCSSQLAACMGDWVRTLKLCGSVEQKSRYASVAGTEDFSKEASLFGVIGHLQQQHSKALKLLKQKDHQLREKDTAILQVWKLKDEALKEKDAKIEQLHKDKDAASKDKDTQILQVLKEKEGQLLVERDAKYALRALLERTTDQILKMQESRDVVGALELAARLVNTQVGVQKGADNAVQAALSSLKSDAEFLRKLANIAKYHPVREEDMLQCLDNIYHSVSKVHTNEEMVYIRYSEIVVPEAHAVIAAIFERFGIVYQCVDFDGTPIMPSPYRCDCLP